MTDGKKKKKINMLNLH